MKNKVMQKALSWVLSAAMVATMSGAIPAMATTVYASGETYSFANDITTNDTIYLGTNGTKTALTDTIAPISWTVKSLDATTKQASKAYNFVQNEGRDANWTANWASEKELYNFDSEELALIESTTIDKINNGDGKSYNAGSVSYTPAGTTTPEDVNVNDVDAAVTASKLYLLSNYEISSMNLDEGTYWTRNTVAAADSADAAKVATGYAATYTFPTAEGSNAAQATTESATYVAAMNLDVTNKSTVLFKYGAAGSYKLAIISANANAAAPKSVTAKSYDAATKAVSVTLDKVPASTSGYSLYYIVTDKAYTEDNASLKVQPTKIAADNISGTTAKFTLASALGDNDCLYVFAMKQAASLEIGTDYVSTPVLIDFNSTATAANFNFSSKAVTYTGAGQLPYVNGGASQSATGNFAADYVSGKSIGDTGTVTITGFTNTDTTDKTAYNVSDKKPTNAGTYTVMGYVAKGAGNGTGDDANITYGPLGTPAAPVALGTFKIDKATLSKSDFSFTLPSVAQYSAQTSVTYTLPTLKLTRTKNAGSDASETTATNVVVTLNDKTSTDTAQTASNLVKDVTFKTLDTASAKNYMFQGGTVYYTGDISLTVTAVANPLTDATIKTQPTNLTYVKGDTFDPAGMVVTTTHKYGNPEDVEYTGNETAFTFSPDLSETLTPGTKTYTVSYTEGTVTKALGSITVNVEDSVVALTNLYIGSKASIAVGGTMAMPAVTYRPTNTTVDKSTLAWHLYTDEACSHPITTSDGAVFVSAAGTESATYTAGDSIKGKTAGAKVYLVAQIGPIASGKMAITVSADNADLNYERVSGADRYATAAAIADKAYANPDDYPEEVVLVSGTGFADALSASAYAGLTGMPVLITAPSKLSDATAKLIVKWNVQKVDIIGGYPSVSENVEAGLKELGVPADGINRISGSDRRATAEAVYFEGNFNTTGACVITTGEKAADALSISPWSYSKHMPVLLAKKDGTLTDTSLAIAKKFSKVYILGNELSVASSVDAALGSKVERISGEDRYDTSAKIAATFTKAAVGGGLNYLSVACGDDRHFADALVAGMLGGNANVSEGVAAGAPIILVPLKGTTGYGFTFIKDNCVKNAAGILNVTDMFFLGDNNAVSDSALTTITSNWSNAKAGTVMLS